MQSTRTRCPGATHSFLRDHNTFDAVVKDYRLVIMRRKARMRDKGRVAGQIQVRATISTNVLENTSAQYALKTEGLCSLDMHVYNFVALTSSQKVPKSSGLHFDLYVSSLWHRSRGCLVLGEGKRL